MAGHSKWANIKHRKGAQDAKRAKVFTKVTKEIIVAAKMGGGDPSMNARLRLALDKARGVNLPKDNIERAIKRGAGGADEGNYEDIYYEGYGNAGVALLIHVLTDNRNRSVSDVRSALNKRGGSMADSGSVSWIFERKGVIMIEASAAKEDVVMDIALENGAEDVQSDSEGFTIITEAGDYETVKNAFDAKGIVLLSAEVTMRPKNTVDLDETESDKLMTLVDALEDIDDVQAVYSNEG